MKQKVTNYWKEQAPALTIAIKLAIFMCVDKSLKTTCSIESDVRYGRFPEGSQNSLEAANAVREQLQEDFAPIHNFARFV